MGTLDIKNFPAHGVSDEDTFLMTDAKNGFVAGSMTLKDMKERVIVPLVEALSLDYELLTQAEYDAVEKKKEGTLYAIEEDGKLVRTYIGSLPLTVGGSLGSLDNVDETADHAGSEDVVLMRAKGSGTWTLKRLSEIGGGGGGTGVQRNVRIVNNLDSKNILASKGEPCLLNFTFVSQERYADSEPYEDTGERGLLQISVRNGDHSDYLAVKQVYVNSASPVALDVAEFLSSGANNVMIKVTGEVTEITTPAFVYTVQLTALSIFADNFRWWTAYLGAIILPLNIGGNIAKTLHVSMSGKDYNESYEVAIGTNVYIETAYNYTIPHPGKTGVFRVSAYVGNSDESIKTKTVAFNIICAVAGERVKLIAVNNVLEKATNWVENTLFDYAMYDGDSVSTFARFVIMKEGQQVFSSNENSIAVSTKHTFSLPLEIDTLDNSEFSIQVEVLDESVALTSPLVFPVNNSLGYSAVAGATLYVNPRTRNNRQENYREVVNEMNGTAIAAGWKNMNWGNDGWVPDSDGNRVLRLMAGSSLAMAYYPFARECARVGKTLEIDYRVDHVTDYSKPIVTISTPDGVSFTGLNIYADQIVMHSQSLREDSVQSLHTFEGKRTRFTLTILPMAYGNPDFNLCILYINGVKNREFAYEDNDYFAQRGGIVIGSDCADVDIYGIREYDSGLTSQGVLTNYINWLSDSAEKARVRLYNDILDGNGSEVDFDNTRDQFNCLVFDNTIPSMADQTARVGNLDVLFTDHPEWNVSISGVTAKGQGTSSMKYWIWNTRYQLDKAKSVITHADGTTSTKKWQMVPWIPAGQKFTAKKNFASSMQSHKIGSVNAYNDLYREVGLRNEAMETEQYADARVAVYQMPFVCFEKSVNEEGRTVYTFRGLYTFGPDKGDKYTFGFDTDLFPNLISIEGSDNSPLCTLFRVPWNNNVFYNSDEEAFQYNGANSWDAGEGKVESISKFIPAYNIVYECSPRLLPFDGTPEELNEQAAAMRTRPCEFWIAKAGDGSRFDVFYFEASLNRFIPSDTGKGVMNLVTQLVDKGYGLSAADLSGKTNDELNALFVNARIAKFRAEAPLYWDVDDTLFFMNNVEFNAGTDERAKNTYPYSFGTETSRFRWRVDDADTRFDTTNRGLPNKEYSVETHDTDETGASIWNGETNNFFNLMELAFPEEKVASMRGMMTAMQSLGGLKSGNDLEKIYAFYQKYFFDEAQEYFPANSYNADARYCYENGKLAYRAGIYSNDTDPITQSLGDHYQAEQRWITKRILYMMSKYSFGLFSAAGTDTITVRAAGNTITYDLTPAMDMYPAIANGTSIIRAGETCSMVIELSGTGDQQNAIQGASYLQDIGDWYDKNVQGSMVIQGRMLREIRLGSKTGHIVISITSLTISNCTSLQKLVLSNIATLSGTLNLTSCTHLQEVYADGTSLSQMKLPTGGSMRVIEFSPRNQYLSLSNYPLLPTEGVRMDQCKHIITDFFVEDCPLLHPVELLVEVMEAQKQQGTEHALKRVRVVGFNETYNSSDILDKLASLADGSYEGLSSEGIAGEDPVPVLDGTLNIHADAYEDSINALRSKFNRLVLNITGNYYVRFKDPEFHRLVVKRWSTDGVGVTRKQLAAVTDFPNDYFKDNKEITDLSDFANNFVNVNLFKQRTFENCTGLKTISLPSEKIDTSAIAIFGHTSLDENGIDLSCLTTLGFGIFRDCRFVHVFIPNTLLLDMDYSQQWQDNLRLLTMELEEGLSVVPNSLCSGCRLLTTIIFPSTITTIGGSVVHGCNNLKNFICKPITPPALVSDLGYIYTDFNIYVPDESVEIYKIAWTKYESKIKPMSQKPENV
ncbi:leucine-rich repeat protein [Butyricimonas virosa]|uniref:leucine-rich repeat protein n=1 Tax=Butyricimonas virosa TaxID=544645 RepID=UPI000E44B2EC|nr:leucine-rich repeat protein [Butyricimonas virosa]RGL83145.1 leucine-rich repeat domain-containing protein [Butyricimonas virosa]